MTEKMCRVSVDGETREYKAGTTYQQIAEDFQSRYAHQIVLAYEDARRLRELRKPLEERGGSGSCGSRWRMTVNSGSSRPEMKSDTVRIKGVCASCWSKRSMMWLAMTGSTGCGSIFPLIKDTTVRSREM